MSNISSFIQQPLFPFSSLKSPEFFSVHTYAFENQEKLELYATFLGEIKALWKSATFTKEIPSHEIEGIPVEMRLHPEKLARFLQDTYAKVLPRSNGTVAVRIFFRLRGGGHSFSKAFPQSSHSQQPLPPRRSNISYQAGFPIRKIDYPPVSGGKFVEEKRDLTKHHWSIVFESPPNSTLRPSVKITVWRKDYYIGYITALTNLKSSNTPLQAFLKEEIERLDRSTQEVAQTILTQAQEQNQVEQELDEVSLRLEATLATFDSKALERQEAYQKFKGSFPLIRTLINFLPISQTLGIPLAHAALSSFKNYENDLKSLIPVIPGEEASENILTAILSHYSAIEHASQAAKGKEIIAILGPTGVGKSTIVNHLLGLEMQERAGGESMCVKNLQEEKAKIGHSLALSETLLAQVCHDARCPFTLTDCGGFFDTREDPALDIVVSASILKTFTQAQNVKMVFCVEAKTIDDNKATALTENLHLLFTGLLKDKFSNAIIFLFTKPHRKRNGQFYSTKDALDSLEAICQEIEGKPEERLYQHILREEGKYVHVYDPLNVESRNWVYQRLQELESIASPQENLQAAYTDKSLQKILEAVIPIATQAVQDYEAFSGLQTECDDLTIKKIALTAKKRRLQTRLETIKTSLQKERLSENKLDEEVKAKKKEKEDLDRKIQAIESEIARLSTEDEIIYESTEGPCTVRSGFVELPPL